MDLCISWQLDVLAKSVYIILILKSKIQQNEAHFYYLVIKNR